LRDSLIDNLLFNERRQKDSIKLFEISDIYSNDSRTGKRFIGIIASGRIDKNYLDFSTRISVQYLEQILSKNNIEQFEIIEISRQSLNSKSKNPIIYCEINVDKISSDNINYDELSIKDINNIQYVPVSEFPSSKRDLSFSVKDFSKCKKLEELILNFENTLLKEVFVFDYYKNEKMKEIKIGFRFIFQSTDRTLKVEEIDYVMNDIIKQTTQIKSVDIPGI
jgi:phenylalanyl-tRNA synthetase beta chain